VINRPAMMFMTIRTMVIGRKARQVAAQHGFTASETKALVLDETELAAVRAESDAMRRRGVTSVPAITFT
jgi:2-hydroxychromene-2-carboxylate isomerase